MKTLLSFIGTNDAGLLLNKKDGAILTALENEKFDEVILLWNEATLDKIKFSDILLYLKREIKKRNLAKKVLDNEFLFNDVTDHNEIYSKLKEFTDTLEKSKSVGFTVAISSGTPAMQVCWILLAESGDFSETHILKLIKITDPKFGKSKNVEVKLNTTLPKIISLRNEIQNLKENLIPNVVINIERGTLVIGKDKIDLSPVEFCYYRYFIERVLNNKATEKFGGYNVSVNFVKSICNFHEESFASLDANRIDMEKMIEKEYDLPITTFRGHISKINKKIKKVLNNETLFNSFKISSEGKRGAKFYGIEIDKEKIKILKT